MSKSKILYKFWDKRLVKGVKDSFSPPTAGEKRHMSVCYCAIFQFCSVVVQS